LRKEKLPDFLVQRVKEKLVSRLDGIIKELDVLSYKDDTASEERIRRLNDYQEEIESLRQPKIRNKRRRLRVQLIKLIKQNGNHGQIQGLKNELNELKWGFSAQLIKTLSERKLRRIFLEDLDFEKKKLAKDLENDPQYIVNYFMEMTAEYKKRITPIIRKMRKGSKELKRRIYETRIWEGFGSRMGYEDYYIQMYKNLH